MFSNNNQSNQKKGLNSRFIKFYDNIRLFQLQEWITLLLFSLFGFIGFLLGFIFQTEHVLIGHALMEFSPLVTLGAITGVYHRFVLRHQIAGEIDVKFEILKKEVLQELHLFLANSTEDLSEAVVKRLAGTTHIIAKGIVNIFEGLDLKRILLKCNTTTLFLQRVYFSPNEFKQLEDSITDLIIKNNCRIEIILISPNQTEIIREIVNNCSKYESNEESEAVHIGLVIVSQIKKIKRIIESLPENKRDHLQVKLLSGNMQTSITGYEEIIFAGKYLNNDIAEEGFQEMIEGKNTRAYQLLHHHFSANWSKATSI
jgi:hypothetical protein